MTMTRDVHLAWCKKRALECVDAGDLKNAARSMLSDMRKHPETANHSGIEMDLMLMMGGHLSNARNMRNFIEGFN